MTPEKAPRQRGLVIVNKAERLIIDLGAHIDKIPKHQRYRYAIRLEDELWELVRRLIEAAMSNQKSKVYRADEPAGSSYQRDRRSPRGQPRGRCGGHYRGGSINAGSTPLWPAHAGRL